MPKAYKNALEKDGTAPQIEDEILKVLDSDLRKGALEFIAYLRENNLTPHMWFGPGYWTIPYKNNNLFGIHFYGLNPRANNNGWVFWFFSGDYSCQTDKELINFVWENTGPCVKCSDECEVQGINMKFFGREYSNICYQFPVGIENPDREKMEKIKKLIDFWKKSAAKQRAACSLINPNFSV